MRKKTSIDQLKKEGKVNVANQVPPPEKPIILFDEINKVSVTEYDAEIAERLKSLAKAKKVSIEDLFIWIEENYGKRLEKPKTGSKGGKNEDLADKITSNSKFTSDWRKNYVAAKTGIKS